MKYKFLTTPVIGVFSSLILFWGIIRHDVDEKEYLQLAVQKQFDCVGQVFKDTTASASCVLIS